MLLRLRAGVQTFAQGKFHRGQPVCQMIDARLLLHQRVMEPAHRFAFDNAMGKPVQVWHHGMRFHLSSCGEYGFTHRRQKGFCLHCGRAQKVAKSCPLNGK